MNATFFSFIPIIAAKNATIAPFIVTKAISRRSVSRQDAKAQRKRRKVVECFSKLACFSLRYQRLGGRLKFKLNRYHGV
jgi:hypothetical protein